MSQLRENETLLRRIQSRLATDPHVKVSGTSHEVYRMVYANVTGLAEQVKIGVYLPDPGRRFIDKVVDDLRERLPKEGQVAEDPMFLPKPYVKYKEIIGQTRQEVKTTYEVADPDFLAHNADNPNVAPIQKETLFGIPREIYVRVFPTQSLADLFVKYNQGKSNYEWNMYVGELLHSTHQPILQDALDGKSLDKYLVPIKPKSE